MPQRSCQLVAERLRAAEIWQPACVVGKLLVEKRRGLVLIPHGTAAACVAHEGLAELSVRVRKRAYVLLNHPESHMRAFQIHVVEDLFRSIVLVRVGKQPVDDPVPRHRIFTYWHGKLYFGAKV